jgi:hypothetical protein
MPRTCLTNVSFRELDVVSRPANAAICCTEEADENLWWFPSHYRTGRRRPVMKASTGAVSAPIRVPEGWANGWGESVLVAAESPTPQERLC